MIARRGILGILAGAVSILTLGACGSKVSRLRYRLVIDIRTPDGIKTGSGVLEDAFYPGNAFEYSAGRRTYGEAPRVALGEGRYAFAILFSPWPQHDLQTMISTMFSYADYPPGADSSKLVDQFSHANRLKPQIVIKPERYPTLVVFDDINDPASVRLFDQSLVHRIVVKVVDHDEPLTDTIEQIIPWLDEHRNKSLNHPHHVRGALGQVPLAQSLNATNFRWIDK